MSKLSKKLQFYKFLKVYVMSVKESNDFELLSYNNGPYKTLSEWKLIAKNIKWIEHE